MFYSLYAGFLCSFSLLYGFDGEKDQAHALLFPILYADSWRASVLGANLCSLLAVAWAWKGICAGDDSRATLRTLSWSF